MSCNCEIVSYTFKNDFNKDTFKGLNVFSEEIFDGKNYDYLINITTDNGYVISKNKIYFITHDDYTEIDQIDGIINVKLKNYPKKIIEEKSEELKSNQNFQSTDEDVKYINYFHDMKDFIFEKLKINKEDEQIIIIRDVKTNQIFITNGDYIKIFYKKSYSKFLERYLYNQFANTYRC